MAEERAQDRLANALRRVLALRAQLAQDVAQTARRREVKRWQSQRLRGTYQDLFAQARYAQAGEFFLTELYGDRDFTRRDSEALRIVPKLARFLPDRALTTLAMAIELDELSEVLDARVAAQVGLPIDEASYARAYCVAGTRAERERQIEMVDRIGQALDHLAGRPGLVSMLRLMRGPAQVAGLDHLHRFLQIGFDAFRAMRGGAEFLATIRARETDLMRALFAGGGAGERREG